MEMKEGVDDGGISCPHDRIGNRVPNRNTRPLRNAALVVEDLVGQGAEVPACAVDVVMGEEDHHLALADVRILQGAVGHRIQGRAEVVDRGVASSVVVDVDPVLGEEVAPLQDEAETLGQGPVEKLEGGWLGWGDPLYLAPLALGHSSRRL